MAKLDHAHRSGALKPLCVRSIAIANIPYGSSRATIRPCSSPQACGALESLISFERALQSQTWSHLSSSGPEKRNKSTQRCCPKELDEFLLPGADAWIDRRNATWMESVGFSFRESVGAGIRTRCDRRAVICTRQCDAKGLDCRGARHSRPCCRGATAPLLVRTTTTTTTLRSCGWTLAAVGQ